MIAIIDHPEMSRETGRARSVYATPQTAHAVL
jgi:hypothetical protein